VDLLGITIPRKMLKKRPDFWLLFLLILIFLSLITILLNMTWTKDESVPDENLVPPEPRLQPDNVCWFCGYPVEFCVCDKEVDK
jgi:hypothetical protein